MSTILDTILRRKHEEVAERRERMVGSLAASFRISDVIASALSCGGNCSIVTARTPPASLDSNHTRRVPFGSCRHRPTSPLNSAFR